MNMQDKTFNVLIKPGAKKLKSFVFKNKQFPFDFELIKNNLNFFFKNQDQYEQIQYIELFSDDEQNIYKDIKESAIITFIELSQSHQCGINESNLFYIRHLAKKTNLLN